MLGFSWKEKKDLHLLDRDDEIKGGLEKMSHV
jgi:hypothetical protein